jgi:large subunit ribosomal protein L23
MASLDNILLRPVLTEKTAGIMNDDDVTRLVFRVKKGATKTQIREAVESTFGVKVASVNTLRMPGKPKRFGRFQGRRSGFKKAIITLREGESFDLFALEDMGEDVGEV